MAANQVAVEALSSTNYGDASALDIHGNSQGAQYVVQTLGQYGVASAAGNVYVAGNATAVAPVAAVPTTAAHLTLWNGESQTGSAGKMYSLISASWYTVVSAGAAFVGQLFLTMTTVATAVPTGTTATAIAGLSGLSTGSSATVLGGVTVVNNGVWHPFGPSVNAGAATATIALGGETYTQGEYILRPGMRLSAAVVCSAAASATCSIFFKWMEIPLKLGR
jgi:hypothetical protein